MLTGDAAAAAQAFFQNVVTGVQHALHLLAVAFVEKQNRVDVAVAGMKNVGDPDLVLFADALNLTKNMGQLRARHDSVLRAIAGREAADRAKCLLAAFPEELALGFACRLPYLAGL